MSGTLHPDAGDPAVRDRAAGRLVGIDLARLVAVAGMMAAHTLGSAEAMPAAVVALVDGPPSTLFAVLGGVSVTLAGRARLVAGDRGGAVRATLARGAVVALLGVLIAPLATAVYVVLVPFGVAIALAAPLLLAPSWLLATLATAIVLGGGSVVTWAGSHLPSLHRASDVFGPLESLLPAVNDVLLTGVYPALIWLGYLLIGMLLMRGLLAARAAGTERAMLTRVAGAGALLTGIGVAMSELGVLLLSDVVAPGEPSVARDWLLSNGYGAAPDEGPLWQLLAAPHTGTPADMARTAGIALLAIGLLGLLVQRCSPRTLRAIEPLRAAGGAPLTIYIVHVVGYSLAAGLLIEVAPAIVSGWGGWAVQVAIALAIGAVLAASGARGPFERLVGRAASLAAGERR
ncbi:heparan-alpha-glucosaminide N-acetyltransferase domain-containing protein [Agrococcus sp. Ld7]|uniref:heparan-alpha-glucosaminide N-acetyltransferase domain-containing protein n=1 Tax=Agrococcus sp. Ld7 TaxID=649148 RepID=UPI003868D38E